MHTTRKRWDFHLTNVIPYICEVEKTMRGGMSTHEKEAVESDDNNKGPNDGVGGRQRVLK
jgi:hypothetical protein